MAGLDNDLSNTQRQKVVSEKVQVQHTGMRDNEIITKGAHIF